MVYNIVQAQNSLASVALWKPMFTVAGGISELMTSSPSKWFKRDCKDTGGAFGQTWKMIQAFANRPKIYIVLVHAEF